MPNELMREVISSLTSMGSSSGSLLASRLAKLYTLLVTSAPSIPSVLLRLRLIELIIRASIVCSFSSWPFNSEVPSCASWVVSPYWLRPVLLYSRSNAGDTKEYTRARSVELSLTTSPRAVVSRSLSSRKPIDNSDRASLISLII